MKGAWRIGKLAGIDVAIHWTFAILIAWVLCVSSSRGVAAAAFDVSLLLAVFGCVLLHELGHAMAARMFGIPTHRITLLPIGGVAELDHIPKEPWREWIIALAGPAVNVLLAGMLFPACALVASVPSSEATRLLASFLQPLAWMNVSLVLFNLIPAFPMDGGRLLRSVLAERLNYVTATRWATRVGQVMAAILLGLGLFWNPLLMLIGLFIAVAAEGEWRQVCSQPEPIKFDRPYRIASLPWLHRRQTALVCWTLPNGVIVVRNLPRSNCLKCR